MVIIILTIIISNNSNNYQWYTKFASCATWHTYDTLQSHHELVGHAARALQYGSLKKKSLWKLGQWYTEIPHGGDFHFYYKNVKKMEITTFP